MQRLGVRVVLPVVSAPRVKLDSTFRSNVDTHARTPVQACLTWVGKGCGCTHKPLLTMPQPRLAQRLGSYAAKAAAASTSSSPSRSAAAAQVCFNPLCMPWGACIALLMHSATGALGRLLNSDSHTIIVVCCTRQALTLQRHESGGTSLCHAFSGAHMTGSLDGVRQGGSGFLCGSFRGRTGLGPAGCNTLPTGSRGFAASAVSPSPEEDDDPIGRSRARQEVLAADEAARRVRGR